MRYSSGDALNCAKTIQTCCNKTAFCKRNILGGVREFIILFIPSYLIFYRQIKSRSLSVLHFKLMVCGCSAFMQFMGKMVIQRTCFVGLLHKALLASFFIFQCMGRRAVLRAAGASLHSPALPVSSRLVLYVQCSVLRMSSPCPSMESVSVRLGRTCIVTGMALGGNGAAPAAIVEADCFSSSCLQEFTAFFFFFFSSVTPNDP